MTQNEHHFDDLEARLMQGFQWSDHGDPPPVDEVARWVDTPVESLDAVESHLANDPHMRSAAMDLRLHGIALAEEADESLRNRLHQLMPDRPSVITQIGGWAVAAAAAVLLAIGGWQLGTATVDARSPASDSLAIATFGLSGSEQDDASFLTFVTEESTP